MSIPEISPGEARERQSRGAILIDVREEHERALGMAQAARGIAKAALESDPDAYLSEHNADILLICQSGARSLQAARTLLARGYTQVASVQGGTTRWIADGLPVTEPASGIDHDFHDRYSRHLRLPEVGIDGQKKLEAAHVLLVGAGGLG